jgi:hypothetical protein
MLAREFEQLDHAMMPSFDRFAALAAALLATAVVLPARAGAFDLTGAWSTDDADLCSRVFTNRDNQIGFAELSDLYGSGFIVDGNRIKGKAAQCTIVSRKQEGDSIELSAACASSIMTQNLKFNLKIIDENTVNRIFDEIPGMTQRYTRCNL